jgi:predicted adenine nucleotide alpha hydrolase (AANH) superfamily ATPase
VRLLLHVCCGPCACGAIPFWQKESAEIVGFFFNPNIQPLLEYRRRLVGAGEATDHVGVPLVVDESYDPEAWFTAVSASGGLRCERCIGLRMQRAAQEAIAQGCECFSTSLSISPWQNQETIRSQGEMAGKEHGVGFRYADLRSCYAEARRLSRELGLYRQEYCGCLVSEWERYRERR